MLFGKKDGAESPQKKVSQARPTVGRESLCRICSTRRQFTRCWLRVDMMTQCPGCGDEFQNPAQLYAQFQPLCPKCEEYLEQPGFEYGFCDVCGSKHELVTGAKPGLLPNRQQRAEMNKNGKIWRKE